MVAETIPATSPAHLDMVRVLRTIASVLRRRPVVPFLLAIVLDGLPSLLPLPLLIAMTTQPDRVTLPELTAAMAVIVVMSSVLHGLLIQTTIRVAAGQSDSFGPDLLAALRGSLLLFALRLPVLLVIAHIFLASSLTSLALLLFGLPILCRWVIAAPLVVAERAGVFGAVARSAALTQGSRWPILGLIVAELMVEAVLVTVVVLVFQWTGSGSIASGAATVVAVAFAGLLRGIGGRGHLHRTAPRAGRRVTRRIVGQNAEQPVNDRFVWQRTARVVG